MQEYIKNRIWNTNQISLGFCLLLKRVIETIQNEAKEQKRGFHGMLLGTLSESLLGNMLTGNLIIRAVYCTKDLQSRKEKGIIRASYGSKGF